MAWRFFLEVPLTTETDIQPTAREGRLDPRPIGFFGCGLARYRAADIPIDPTLNRTSGCRAASSRGEKLTRVGGPNVYVLSS